MAGQRDRAPRTLLDELLRRRDTATHREIVAEFDKTARELGVSVTMSERHLTRIAAGRSGAGADTRRVLQAMFNTSPEELLAKWPNRNPTASTPRNSTASLTEKEQIMAAAQRAKRFTMAQEAGLSVETLDQVTADLAELVTLYQVQPLSEILPDLVELQSDIFSLIDNRKMRPQQARQMYVAGGITTGLLAKASHDLARPHEAMTQARAAHLCAELADHDGLRAWLHGLQALVAYWAGRHQTAIRHTQQGTAFAGRVNSTAAVWLTASEARAWAALGNEEESLAAIERAERARDAVQENELDALGGIALFGDARQTYYAAEALTWLPEQSERAQRYSQNAVVLYGELQSEGNHEYAFGDAGGAASNLAISRINSPRPDFEGATEALESVLALPPTQRINGIIHSVNRVHESIRRSPLADEATAEELLAAIEDFTGLTAASVHKG